MAIRDESEFLHVADHRFRELAREVANFISHRMREMDPENADKPQCNGCVGTVLLNTFIMSADDNRWSPEEIAEATLDFQDRLEDLLNNTTMPLPAFLMELLKVAA